VICWPFSSGVERISSIVVVMSPACSFGSYVFTPISGS
jgi:hypothetical protein